MKLNKLFAIGLLASLLVGCYDKGELKTIIQDGYDKARANTQAKGDFCYYLGSVKFPYTDEPLLEDDIQWTVWNKGKLAKTLPLFTDIGLLTREPVADQSGLYHYDLTELGREYQHMFIDLRDVEPIYNNAFCYGIKNLIEVRDVTEKERGGGQGNACEKRTEVTVKFTYHLLEVPEWVLNNKEKLASLYSSFGLNENNDPYVDSVTLIKKSDVGMRIIKEDEAISLLKVGFKLGELLKSTTDKVTVKLLYQNQATPQAGQEQAEPLLFEYETGVWQS